MGWNNPRKGWHWLLLGTPAVLFLVLNLVAYRWGAFFLPGDAFRDLTLLFYSLLVALALSIGLGLWLAWPIADWSERIGSGLACGIAIAVVNLVVVFGSGCTMGFVIRRIL